MSLTSVRGGAIWWTLTKKRRHGVFTGKTLWSMPERFEIYIVYKKALYKYSSFPFLYIGDVQRSKFFTRWNDFVVDWAGLPKNRNPRNPRNLRNPYAKISKSTDELRNPLPKIEIHKVHKIHSKATLAKYRNPRNPQTVRNPHWQGSQQTNRQLL